ncbi:MAG TPA: glycosyl hydrolase, partial [Blastocatellia bacterium]|nr:glycosyl hydrolase [Blastocatellia bacterium]
STLTSLAHPDLSLAPSVPEIGFIHRRAGDAEIYFLANTDNMPHKTKATFRTEGMEPDWWDPMTGGIRPAAVVDRGAGSISVALELAPYESRVLVFSRRASTSTQALPVFAGHPQEIDLSTGWQVTFGDNGTPVKMDSLHSWTDDEKTRYYSGLAAYEKTFSLPGDFLSKGVRAILDFGEGKPTAPQAPRTNGMRALLEGPVREAAVVTVNGRRAGSVWCPPYSVDVTEFLKSGENRIRIVVGNTAINHMSGHALPDYRLLNLRYGERFQAQDMDKVQPVEAGLLGSIRLLSNSK